jgi:hypothetical protein
MSNLYLYLSHKSFVDNKSSIFFNYLSNNYQNSHLNIDSINYKIFSKILNTLNPDINIHKDISNNQFKTFINKHIYNLLNNNINTYIDTLIDDKIFIKELFTNNKFQYYTNHSNEILRLLSDNNTNISETFNISKNYNMYKTKFLNVKKTDKQKQLKDKTIRTLKERLYEIYIIIDGLEKIMYSNYNNLLEYENKKFDDILHIIKNMYGNNHLNHKNIHNIYFLYSNKTIDYYDIYYDILTYPSLKDKIVTMFIQFNYLKYNEKMNELSEYQQYKHIITKIFNKFIDDKEQDDDDEILNLSEEQKELILNQAIKKMFSNYKKKLITNFSKKYVIDNKSFIYNNIYNEPVNNTITPIPINFVNNINLDQYKQHKLKESNTNSLITNQDIIHEIIPDISETNNNTNNIYNLTHNNLINEAENRLKFIEENKDDVDYMNHTINFFTDNFEDDENLTRLTEAISFLNSEYINHFNINVLRVKSVNNKSSRDNTKLLDNIINDITEDDQEYNNTKNTYIIDDYHPLSPIYETNFSISIEESNYKFKTLLHYIYFNQYLELYKVYYKYSSHTELTIISQEILAYNLLFKDTILNIFEETKSIISNKTNFKNFSELQLTYYDLLNNIKYFIFKLDINEKINNDNVPYFNFILSYTEDLNIIYSDKEDNYLGIGKYGNGDNMVGIFFNEYKSYVGDNNIFEYNFNDIFLILCNFNVNVNEWFKLKLQDLLHHIIVCCVISNNYNIDTLVFNNIIDKLFPQFNETCDIYFLPTHESFTTYIKQTLQTISNLYTQTNTIIISDNVIDEIWTICFIIINNIFEFKNNIIENSDNFQTFINYYDKHNIEHLLYYTLSLYTYDNIDDSLKEYISTKNKQLEPFSKEENTNYTKHSINLLYNNNIDNSISNFNSLTNEYNKSLQFDINSETKYINIIKSKLSLYQ